MSIVRDTKRGARRRNEVPAVAIAGYTNAGKSSLLNALTGAGVLVEDALFATLDPTTRRFRTDDGRAYTLSDTVGFVRHLPHQLVEAFRSTLEEVATADLLLHVVDGSDPMPEEQIGAVREVLAEIGEQHGGVMPPELLVVNKVDAAGALRLARLRHRLPDAVFVSARTGEGLDRLRAAVAARLPEACREVEVLVPYADGALAARVHEHGQVLDEEHRAEGTWLRARVSDELAGALRAYRVVASST
jgi:GTP-binding protein HflX